MKQFKNAKISQSGSMYFITDLKSGTRYFARSIKDAEMAATGIDDFYKATNR